MEGTYQKFLQQEIDIAPLGVERSASDEAYFCTPKGATIIGTSGVDGIHYCFVRGFGEMVFAVSPMNIAPDYVHPLAANFTDFLRLLLACGDAAALEQAWMWDKARFETFLAENPVTVEQRRVLTALATKMHLTAMEQPWEYIKALQLSFDYSKIPYTQELLEPNENPAAESAASEWRVGFAGGFWEQPKNDRAGKEIAIGRRFDWANRQWIIPAVYVCSEDLVVDFCMRVETEALRNFMQKWNLTPESDTCEHFTPEQQMELERENPLCLDFQPQLKLDGQVLRPSHGCGISYNPCLPDEQINAETKLALDHYGLDAACGWAVWRKAFPWKGEERPTIKSLSLVMKQAPMLIPGLHFRVSAAGETVVFAHPASGKQYTLTVQEIEQAEIEQGAMAGEPFGFGGWEGPTHYCTMRYTVSPEIPERALKITDCAESDPPREKAAYSKAAHTLQAAPGAAAIGIIGGADGPTAIILGAEKQEKSRVAYSALHFSPVSAKDVQWRMAFYEKGVGRKTIELV